jgi:hypothetical protein
VHILNERIRGYNLEFAADGFHHRRIVADPDQDVGRRRAYARAKAFDERRFAGVFNRSSVGER